jgi:hypothetical protein
MFQAQMLIRGAATTKVYSPWFPRGGDAVTITADLVALGGSPTLTVRVYTKASSTVGDGGTAVSPTGTLIALAAVGRASCEYNSGAAAGMNELVRYGYECSSASAGDWVLFRMLPPVWFDAVKT